MHELYKYTKDGIRYWSIDWDYGVQEIIISHGVHNGSLQTNYEDVELNQSGRTIEEQIDLRVQSRISSKVDIGYRYSIEEAQKAAGTNILGHYRPMLATRYDKIKNVAWPRMCIQMKYDGHRCMIRRTPQGYVAYSRNGKPIRTINHITDSMAIPVGTTLDGELYCHGIPLQTISSWVKKEQPSTRQIEYVVYDIVSTDPYIERLNKLNSFNLGMKARVAPTDKSVEEFMIPMLLSSAIESGYEGLIIRDKQSEYESGKRSKGLIKIKQFDDDEFLVTDVISSADGWGILVCNNHDDVSFRVSAPGPVANKTMILNQKENYIGKLVTIQFANMTNDNIPFHPVAIRFREDI